MYLECRKNGRAAETPGSRVAGSLSRPLPGRSLSRYSAPVIPATLFLPFALSIFLLATSTALGAPKFRASKCEGHGSEFLVCDLDGDHLKDLVVFEQTNLAVFYQDPNRGFSKEASQRYDLGNQPALVWAAHLGPGADRLLLMTGEGVAQLCFTNRTSDPSVERIIRQRTVIPPRLEKSPAPAMHFPLSVNTGSDWPLVLVPVEGGLQVWRHDQEWQLAQTLERALETRLGVSAGAHPGYTSWLGLSLGVGDLNSDGREDLIVRRPNATGTII